MPFQPSLMFTSKDGALHKWVIFKVLPLGWVPSHTDKYQTKLDILATDKRSSLCGVVVSDKDKRI